MGQRLTVKGQVTLPKAVRDHLRVRPGEAVRFVIRPDGGVEVEADAPAEAWRELAGLWRGPDADAYLDMMRGPPESEE